MLSRAELGRALSGYRWAKRDAEALLREIEALRDRKTSAAFTQDGSPRPTKPRDLSDYIIALEALEESLDSKLQEETQKLELVMTLIWAVPPGRDRTLLILRYINCLPWQRVAEELHYSMRNTYRAHNEALDECRRLMSPDFTI